MFFLESRVLIVFALEGLLLRKPQRLLTIDVSSFLIAEVARGFPTRGRCQSPGERRTFKFPGEFNLLRKLPSDSLRLDPEKLHTPVYESFRSTFFFFFFDDSSTLTAINFVSLSIVRRARLKSVRIIGTR